MKRLIHKLLIGSLAVVPSTAFAEAYKSVLVTFHDATTICIKGEQNLTMSVENEEVRFFTTVDSHISFPLENVKSLSLSSREGDANVSAINEIDASEISFQKTGDSILLTNLPASSHIAVTALSGLSLYNVEAEGELTIDTSTFAPGVYVITINHKTFRIAISR